MTNRHVGYVYLVDEQCRVRWAGCADPMPAEAEALRVCTSILLDRLDAAKAQSESASSVPGAAAATSASSVKA